MKPKKPKPKPKPKLKNGTRTDRYGKKPTLARMPWEETPENKDAENDKTSR